MDAFLNVKLPENDENLMDGNISDEEILARAIQMVEYILRYDSLMKTIIEGSFEDIKSVGMSNLEEAYMMQVKQDLHRGSYRKVKNLTPVEANGELQPSSPWTDVFIMMMMMLYFRSLQNVKVKLVQLTLQYTPTISVHGR